MASAAARGLLMMVTQRIALSSSAFFAAVVTALSGSLR
jgi:hypothetical protein